MVLPKKKNWLFYAVYVFYVVIPLSGQQPQTPTFRSGVTLVTVDVIVLDKDGKPVAGLTADDFDVKLDRASRPVRALDYRQAAGDATAPVSAEARGLEGRQIATNVAPKGEPRVFVVLVDDLSYAPGRGKGLFLAAERFIAKLPASDLVGYSTTSQTIAANPTKDRVAIQAALKKTVGQFSDPRDLGAGGAGDKGDAPGVKHSIGIAEALEIDLAGESKLKDVIVRECAVPSGADVAAQGAAFDAFQARMNAEGLSGMLASNGCASDVFNLAKRTVGLLRQNLARQIAAFQAVISAMKVAPGIKHLVVLSEGLPIFQDWASLEPVAKAAAEAGVQLSVVVEEPDPSNGDSDPRAAETPNVTPGTSRSQRRRTDDLMLMTAVQTVADMTGGNFYRVIGAPDPFFDKIAVASSAVYRLGVEAPAETTPGKAFALAVTVKRPGVTVKANRHAVAPGPENTAPAAAPTGTPDERLMAAITAGTATYGVPLSLAATVRRATAANAPPGSIEIGVTVQVPRTIAGPLKTVFALVDDLGVSRSGKRTVNAAPDGDYVISFAVPVPAGRYRVRFGVADAGGAVGSLETEVIAKLHEVGPFVTSDLLTATVDQTGRPKFLALEELPADAAALNASLELYSANSGSTAPADVHVKFALIPKSGGAPAAERDVAAELQNGGLRAEAQFPIGALASGTYTLRATVSTAGKDVGTVTTTIKKK